MLLTIHGEFRKLTTIRSPWLLLAAGPLLVAAGISGLAESGGNTHDPAVQSQALAHVGLAAMLTLIFGILAVAGEYRHGTITDTYLSWPGRGRVIAAKLAVYGLAGAAAGLVSSGTAVAVTAAWWAAKGGALQLSAGGGLQVLAGAIAIALAWIALVEGITGQLLGSGLARWLPFYASEALDRASLSPAIRLLPQWGGGLVLLGYAAAFTAAAFVTTLRRDVT